MSVADREETYKAIIAVIMRQNIGGILKISFVIV